MHVKLNTLSMQMLWNIDDGKSANIKGIPEESNLKSSVKKLLKLLDLERGEDRDMFRLSPKSSPTLQVLGFVFEEPIETTRSGLHARGGDDSLFKHV